LIAISAEDAFVSDDSICRLSQIGMRVEAGIKKSDRYTAARESFISIHAQRRRQDESHSAQKSSRAIRFAAPPG